MSITVINNFQRFEEIKADWDAVYASDTNATFFVSWPWLRGWFEVRDGKWFILAYKPDHEKSYVAFFPLSSNPQETRLLMGGNNIACHTGFVCLPEYEIAAISSFSEFLKKQKKWEEFQLGNVSDPRVDSFMKSFIPKKYSIQELDRHICPVLELPETWDEYLKTCIGRKTRERLRQYMRKVQNLDKFRVTYAHADNLEQQINAFIKLWQMRWGSRPEKDFEWLWSVSKFCFENDSLWLTIFWNGSVPIAGLKAYIDREHKTFSYCLLGWNNQFSKLSPGNAIVGYSIQYAIASGYKIYDFLGGNEPYKYSLGAKDNFNRSFIITQRNFRRSAKKILKRSHDYASRIKKICLNNIRNQ